VNVLFTVGCSILIVGTALECVLYGIAPRVLGHAAFLPIREQATLDVGPEGQELLSGRKAASLDAEGLPREAHGYRDAPLAPVAVPQSIVTCIHLAPVETTNAYVTYAVAKADEVLLCLALDKRNAFGLVRTRLSFDGHVVTLKSAFLPVGALSFGASTLFFVLASLGAMGNDALVLPVMFFLVLLATGASSWRRLRPLVAVLRGRIQDSIRGMG
jgi:hypothetical protein